MANNISIMNKLLNLYRAACLRRAYLAGQDNLSGDNPEKDEFDSLYAQADDDTKTRFNCIVNHYPLW